MIQICKKGPQPSEIPYKFQINPQTTKISQKKLVFVSECVSESVTFI